MTKKDIFDLVLVGLLVILINGLAYRPYQSFLFENTKKLYCGNVVDINTKLANVKHGTKTEYFLLVNFDNLGNRLIEVNAETFYTHEAGNRICLELSNRFVTKESKLSLFEAVILSIAFLLDIILGIALTVYVFTFVYYSLKENI